MIKSKALRGGSLSSREFADVQQKFIQDYLEGLDTPRSLAVWLMYRSGEHSQLVTLDCNPNDYVDGVRFRDDYAATLLLRKSPFLETGLDLEAVAWEKFQAAEEMCARTNSRFRRLDLADNYIGETAAVLSTAVRKIERVLRDFDAVEWFDGCDWGPGATTSISGDTSRETKFWRTARITPHLHALVGDLFCKAYPQWAELLPTWELEVANKVTFVPKDARGHRTIAIEPDLNIWFQKGVGKMIRKRLRTRAGIDLNTQAHNQKAARCAAVSGHLATLDKSSASDTISTELVRFLIADDVWFSVLDSCRSRRGTYKDSTFRWEKFSSMGNGFTFELETLIFWALAEASCDVLGLVPEVYVYGDDVILPVEAVSLYTSVVDFCGFKLNSAKSFWSGPFRESCGVHYWGVLDCQPLYLKRAIDAIPEIYKAANGVRQLGARRNRFIGCDSTFADCHRRLVRSVPRAYRLAVPSGLGDVGFIVDFDDPLQTSSPPIRRSAWEQAGAHPSWGGFCVRIFTVKSVRGEADHAGVLLARLSSGQSETCWNNSFALRGRTTPRFALVWVRAWGNLGPWI